MSSKQAFVTRLVVELDAGTDPVTGRIGPSSDAMEPFIGWTELAAAMQRLRRQPGEDASLSDAGLR